MRQPSQGRTINPRITIPIHIGPVHANLISHFRIVKPNLGTRRRLARIRYSAQVAHEDGTVGLGFGRGQFRRTNDYQPYNQLT